MTAYPATPGIARRLLSLVYEVLLLTAFVLFTGTLATGISHVTAPGISRLITQVVVVPACVAYFAWQWHHRGQTLPMKTWHMRLQATDGSAVSVPRAILRACLATAGYLCFGVSVLWTMMDRDGQFLHDRLAGTRLVATQ